MALEGHCAGGAMNIVPGIEKKMAEFIQRRPNRKYIYTLGEKKATRLVTEDFTVTEFKCAVCEQSIQVPMCTSPYHGSVPLLPYSWLVLVSNSSKKLFYQGCLMGEAVLLSSPKPLESGAEICQACRISISDKIKIKKIWIH